MYKGLWQFQDPSGLTMLMEHPQASRLHQVESYFRNMGMDGLVSAWAMARWRRKKYYLKVDAATLCSCVCPHTRLDLTVTFVKVTILLAILFYWVSVFNLTLCYTRKLNLIDPRTVLVNINDTASFVEEPSPYGLRIIASNGQDSNHKDLEFFESMVATEEKSMATEYSSSLFRLWPGIAATSSSLSLSVKPTSFILRSAICC